MTKLRVIFTPDEGYESFPKFKIIEGRDAVDALTTLAEFYDVELDDDEGRDTLDNVIDRLSQEDFNLSFVQDINTGKVYLDDAFDS